MKKNLKKLTAVLAAAALTFSLAACGGNAGSTAETTGTDAADKTVAEAENTADTESASTGRTDLHLRIPDAFSTLDPHSLALNADIAMCRQIYDPLYWLNDSAEEVPMLATEYTISDDGLTWTFKLREGVTFQNGDALKASDVVYSFERALGSAYMQEKVEAIASVSSSDDSTVELHLKYPFSALIEKIAGVGIVSEAFTEANMDDQGQLGFNVCGTGAYTVKEVIPDVSVVLTAYDGYWGGTPAIKEVTYEQITDDSTALTAFEAGELDLMNIPTTNWEEISSSDAYTCYTQTANHITYLIFNTQVAPFDNQKLRQAIAYAVNRDDIITIVENGMASPASSMVTPYMFGYDENAAGYDYNPEKAKELLAEAGYPDGLDIGSIKTLGGTYFEKVVQVVQGELAEIGITCTIESLDGNSLVSDCISGNFGIADMGQTNGLDYDFMKTYYSTAYIDSLNMARYSNSEVDALFEEGASTSDRDARLEIYGKVQEIVTDACLYVPLYNKQQVLAWNKDLNYTPTITGYFLKDCSWN